MIAQEIVFTRDFLKASRIRDYVQLKKISCENKKQARARVIYEFFGLQRIEGTRDTHTPFIDDMGVNHGGIYISMSQQLLNNADILA